MVAWADHDLSCPCECLWGNQEDSKGLKVKYVQTLRRLRKERDEDWSILVTAPVLLKGLIIPQVSVTAASKSRKDTSVSVDSRIPILPLPSGHQKPR